VYTDRVFHGSVGGVNWVKKKREEPRIFKPGSKYLKLLTFAVCGAMATKFIRSLPLPQFLPPSVFQELGRIQSLPDGWADGDGNRISPAIVKYVLELLAVLNDVTEAVQSKNPTPTLGPTRGGGIEMSWENDRINLIIEPEDNIAYVLCSLREDIKDPADIEQIPFPFPSEIRRCAVHLSECFLRKI
jgi:hypothetical protein